MKINTLLPATQGPQPQYARRSFEGIVGTGGDEQGSGTHPMLRPEMYQDRPSRHASAFSDNLQTRSTIPSSASSNRDDRQFADLGHLPKHPGTPAWIPSIVDLFAIEPDGETTYIRVCTRVRFESRYSIIACPYAVRTRLVGGHAHHHLLIRDFLSLASSMCASRDIVIARLLGYVTFRSFRWTNPSESITRLATD
ncbi:hypothetical protein ARMGADRAFT_1012426, partial [Armillaria gallica]